MLVSPGCGPVPGRNSRLRISASPALRLSPGVLQRWRSAVRTTRRAHTVPLVRVDGRVTGNRQQLLNVLQRRKIIIREAVFALGQPACHHAGCTAREVLALSILEL